MVMTVSVVNSPGYYWEMQEDYYLNGREPRGVVYAPTGLFGLATGQLVDQNVYVALMEGIDPRTGEQLTQAAANGKRAVGYDLTFEAPKSVSLVWGLAPENLRRKIESIHERAIHRALEVIQAEATFTRLGKDGEQLKRTELFSFLFQHGDARPVTVQDIGALVGDLATKADEAAAEKISRTYSDMHLHTHSVVPNVAHTLDADGNSHWSALDGRCFFAWQKAGGAVYHAEMAALLQRELGAQVRFKRDTTFELEHVPQAVIDRFSKRGNQIKDILAAFGTEKGTSAKLAEAAQTLSREGKEAPGDRHGRWRAEATEHGFGPAELVAVFNRPMEAPRADADVDKWDRAEWSAAEQSSATLREAVDQVVPLKGGAGPEDVENAPPAPPIEINPPTISPDVARAAMEAWETARGAFGNRVTETESVVRQQDLYITAAKIAIEHGQAGDAVIDTVADAIAQGDVIPLGVDEKLAHQAVYSTLDMKRIEARLSRLWQIDIGDRTHVLQAEVVETHIRARANEGKPYTAEQEDGLRWVCLRGGRGSILEGGAGTGKSFSMGGVATLYAEAGYRVIGAATDWDAANILRREAALDEGKAVAKWLSDWSMGKNLPTDRTVLILDESGKIGSRDLHRLSEYIFSAGGKIILTGDQKQQLGVSAGPALAIAAKGAGSQRLEDTLRMYVQADDVLVHLEGLSRSAAIARARALTPEARASIVLEHGAMAERRAKAWAADPANITAADVLVHVQGKGRLEAEAEAAGMAVDQRREIVAAHHMTVAREGAIWARQAATDLSHGRAREALAAFDAHGALVWCDTADEAVERSTDDWAAFKLANPDAAASVGAKTNKDAQAQTTRMRAWLKAQSLVSPDDTEIRSASRRGAEPLMLAVGDQVRFIKRNDKLQVHNGVVGTVRALVPEGEGHALLTVDLADDTGRRLVFSTREIADTKGRAPLEHHYATTTFSIQGATKVRHFGILDANERSNSTYVAGSRAREETRFYVARDRLDTRLRERLPVEERLDRSRTFTDEERRALLIEAIALA